MKTESDYQGINFESKRTKYEQIKSRFCEQYPLQGKEDDEKFPRSNDLDLITKDRVSAKMKSIRSNFKKAVDSGKRSGGGRIIFTFYELCEKIWAGSPAVRSIVGGIDTSSKDNVSMNNCISPSTPEESVLNESEDESNDGQSDKEEENETGPFSSSNTSIIDVTDNCELQEQENIGEVKKQTKERRQKVEEGLKTRREKKLENKLNTDPRSATAIYIHIINQSIYIIK